MLGVEKGTIILLVGEREQEKKDRLDKIKELKDKGLNKGQIAKKIGVSRQAVSKLMKELF